MPTLLGEGGVQGKGGRGLVPTMSRKCANRRIFLAKACSKPFAKLARQAPVGYKSRLILNNDRDQN
jgi:hypothetical protein